MKVRLEIGGQTLFYYQDMPLSCDPDDRERYYRTRPCLIVEVPSETTAHLNRRAELLALRPCRDCGNSCWWPRTSATSPFPRGRGDGRAEYFTDGTIPLGWADEPLAVDAVSADVGPAGPG